MAIQQAIQHFDMAFMDALALNGADTALTDADRRIPTIAPYLPGTVYSKQVWASTLWHCGVTIDLSPYNFDRLKAEVFAGRTDSINTITPERLATQAIAHL